MSEFKPFELGREGKAQRFAEDLVKEALRLLGHPERWVQKRVMLTNRTSCERSFKFHIQLSAIAFTVECSVHGTEDMGQDEKDPLGNRTEWVFGTLEVETTMEEGVRRFRGWLLITGAVHVEPLTKFWWGKLADGFIQVGIETNGFPYKDAVDRLHIDGYGDDIVGEGPTLKDAFDDLIETYRSFMPFEFVEIELKK